MVWTTYRRHLPALVIMMVAIGLWLALLPSLPNPMTVDFLSSEPPATPTPPVIPLIAMCCFMLIGHLVIVLMDLFLFAPVVPGYIMAVTDWIVEGATAIFYLAMLAAALDILPWGVGLAGGFITMAAVLAALYRRQRESIDTRAVPLSDAPYFERARPSFLSRVFFFMNPLFPSYILIGPAGIRLMGVLYDVTYPWDRISEVKKGGLGVFFSNRPIKLNQRLTNTVEIRLKDRRTYVVISAEKRERFLEISEKFMNGHGGTSAPSPVTESV